MHLKDAKHIQNLTEYHLFYPSPARIIKGCPKSIDYVILNSFQNLFSLIFSYLKIQKQVQDEGK